MYVCVYVCMLSNKNIVLKRNLNVQINIQLNYFYGNIQKIILYSSQQKLPFNIFLEKSILWPSKEVVVGQTTKKTCK